MLDVEEGPSHVIPKKKVDLGLGKEVVNKIEESKEE